MLNLNLHITFQLYLKRFSALQLCIMGWKNVSKQVLACFSFPAGVSLGFTHRVSVGRVERVESSVKHPELPGCSSSVHRL